MLSSEEILRAVLDLEHTYPFGAWGKRDGGRRESEQDVRYNLAKHRVSDTYFERITQVSQQMHVPTCIIMAIACRESNHGASLKNGMGDRGNGFGVMQVDVRYHPVLGASDPRGYEHLIQGTGIWRDYLGQVQKRHPEWDDRYLVKGACVAYNSGVKNVQTVVNMDLGTTHDDYGADVMCRAQLYNHLGY